MSRLGECWFFNVLLGKMKSRMSVDRAFCMGLHGAFFALVCNYTFCIIARNCVLQRTVGFLAFVLGDQDLAEFENDRHRCGMVFCLMAIKVVVRQLSNPTRM